jgi:hypothetical protein
MILTIRMPTLPLAAGFQRFQRSSRLGKSCEMLSMQLAVRYTQSSVRAHMVARSFRPTKLHKIVTLASAASMTARHTNGVVKHERVLPMQSSPNLETATTVVRPPQPHLDSCGSNNQSTWPLKSDGQTCDWSFVHRAVSDVKSRRTPTAAAAA